MVITYKHCSDFLDKGNNRGVLIIRIGFWGYIKLYILVRNPRNQYWQLFRSLNPKP